MKKLLKAYEFNSDMQYFERIVFLYKNNDNKAAIQMFKDIPLNYKKLFINAVLGNWKTELTIEDVAKFVAAI